jgi:hypothetical protein
MIKNLARNNQLSVLFIKWGKTIISKGDSRCVPDYPRSAKREGLRGNNLDNIMLSN